MNNFYIMSGRFTKFSKTLYFHCDTLLFLPSNFFSYITWTSIKSSDNLFSTYVNQTANTDKSVSFYLLSNSFVVQTNTLKYFVGWWLCKIDVTMRTNKELKHIGRKMWQKRQYILCSHTISFHYKNSFSSCFH